MKPKDILKQELTDLENVYLLFGEEEYLIKKFIDNFMQKFVESEFEDFNLDFINDDNDEFITRLISTVNQFPFMTEKRVVVVNSNRIFTKKFKKQEQKQLIKLLNDFPETTILLIKAKSKPDKRTKLYKKFKEIGETLEFKSLKYKSLDRWIQQKAKKLDKKIKPGAIKLLEKTFNNNLQRLNSELEKIATYLGEDKIITRSKVEQIISKDRLLKDNIIFDFVDAIGNQNNSRALNLLNEMLAKGQSEIGLLMMMVRQIRLILQSKVLSKEGKSVKKIAKRLNQHPYPIEKCIKQGKNFSIFQLERMLEMLLQSNLKMVTGQDKELELELLILRLKEVVS